MEVIDTIRIQGNKVAVLREFEGNSTFSDIPEIYIHSRNDSVFFHHNNEFYLLYDFTAKDGDTINLNIPTFYVGPGSYAVTPFEGLDPIINVDVVVSDKDSVMVSGQMRRVADYMSLSYYDDYFTIPL